MRKILILAVIAGMGLSLQAQFIYKSSKSTAKMDTLQVKGTRVDITNSSRDAMAWMRVSGDSLYLGDGTGERNLSRYNPVFTGYGIISSSGSVIPAWQLHDLDVTVPDYSSVFSAQITTNTIGLISGNSSTSGGLNLTGFSKNSPIISALSLTGYSGTTMGSNAAIALIGYKSDGGTNRADLSYTEKLIRFRNGATEVSTITGGGKFFIKRAEINSSDSVALVINSNYAGTSVGRYGIYTKTYGQAAHASYNITYNKDAYGTFNLTADTGAYGSYNSTSGINASACVNVTSGADAPGTHSQTSGLRSIPYYGVSSNCDTLMLLIKTTEKFKVTGTGNVVAAGQLKTLHVTAALTDATPTATELNSASGLTASTAGAGYQFFIKDTNGTALVYRVYSDGTDWWYHVFTKAL